MPMDDVEDHRQILLQSAVWSFVAAAASAAPVIRTRMWGGVHEALACTLASHFALQSALMDGGFTVPVHFGASIFAEHEPVQVPEQLAEPLRWQLPPHLPLQVPFTLPEHFPSHLPAQAAPLLGLPSHLPVQLPSHEPMTSASQVPLHSPEQAAAALASQSPEHCAPQLPWSLPPSQVMSALPGFTVASQLAPQLP